MGTRITVDALHSMKRSGELIVMLTCYDYPTAVMQDEAGIDLIFVGDSVGTNILGYESEKEVTMEDMVHHAKAVRRGVRRGLVVVDLPYASYDTADQGMRNARSLRLSKRYAGLAGTMKEAFRQYALDVRERRFPEREHGFRIRREELEGLRECVKEKRQ